MKPAEGPAVVEPILLPALALWGWQTGLLPWAMVMGLVLEARRWHSARLEIPQGDFNRLWNFTVLLFLGTGLYLFLARRGAGGLGALVAGGSASARLEGLRQISEAALTFLRWLPLILFPLVLAHAWSRAATLPWSTFSLYEQARARRKPGAAPPEWAVRRIHPGHLFLAVVLLASTASVDHPVAYLPLLVTVVATALWPWSSPRYRAATRLGLLVGIVGATLLTNRGLIALREAWQTLENRLLEHSGSAFDQTKTVTSIGTVGRLKQSGQIVFRVRTSDGRAPGLLREATYNRLRGTTWTTLHRGFQAVGTTADPGMWRPVGRVKSAQTLTLARFTPAGAMPLALPQDVVSVDGLPLAGIETNQLASARLKDGPSLTTYVVEHGEGGGFDVSPEADDLEPGELPLADRAAIQAVAAELGLATPSGPAAAVEAVAAVGRYFATHFDYSLWQPGGPPGSGAAPLARFLTETRAGHCEYFATATVLLLRQAGIPARYVVGYSPGELRGDEWLARGRDAHAWCLAFWDGRWHEVDTTPGSWRAREAEQTRWWEGVTDVFSQLRYRFNVWRQSGDDWQVGLVGAALVVLAWLGWRQLRGSQWRRASGPPTSGSPVRSQPGLDSEFFTVIRRLEARHGERARHESIPAWLRRVVPAETAGHPEIQEAVALHQQLRFDPEGLPATARRRLRELAVTLVASLSRERDGRRSR